MKNMARPAPSVVPAEEAFIVTVGVSHRHREADCARALRKLQAAGFQCGPTSPESLQRLAEQARLTQALEDND